jgi:hypothetical protein
MIDSICDNLKPQFISNNIWKNSKYEWIYNLPTTVKGKVGELICAEFFRNKNCEVTKYKKPNWDLNVDSMRVEVKLSMLNKTGYFKFLQIRTNDDYTHICFLAIEPSEANIFLVPKDKVDGLQPQHSGKRGSQETMYLGIIPKELKSKYKEFKLEVGKMNY